MRLPSATAVSGTDCWRASGGTGVTPRGSPGVWAPGRGGSQPLSGGFPGTHDARPGPPFLRLQEDREAKLALAARYRALGHEAEVAGDGEAAALCRGLAAEETRHAQVLLDLLAAT